MQINRKFNATELSELELPFPPLLLQDKYALRIQEIRALMREQLESDRKNEFLFQSLLHKAFEGEL
jgi:restriction endonuclease S subunit